MLPKYRGHRGDLSLLGRSSDSYLAALRPASGPLLLPAQGHPGPRTLHLFETETARASPSGSYSCDVVFFCGGAVWALDWCTDPPQLGQEQHDYLAVSHLAAFCQVSERIRDLKRNPNCEAPPRKTKIASVRPHTNMQR